MIPNAPTYVPPILLSMPGNSILGNLTGSSATPYAISATILSTASTFAVRDANGNLSMVNAIEGYTTTATAAGTTTLTVVSNYYQFFTGSTTQIVQMPAVSTLALGMTWYIQNNSTGAVTINSSGANAIVVLAAGTSASITCILLTGATAASWSYSYTGNSITSGKKLSISNILTLAGTDSTVMTFPTTSASIARTDATQTFTGTQTFSSAPTISPFTTAGVIQTSSSGVLSVLASPETPGFVLSSTNGGVLSWIANSTGGMANPMTTTGDLIYSSSGSIPARLAVGTANQVLIGGTIPTWASTISLAGSITSTAATSANGTIIAGQAAMGTFQTGTGSWFGPSGSNVSTVASISGFVSSSTSDYIYAPDTLYVIAGGGGITGFSVSGTATTVYSNLVLLQSTTAGVLVNNSSGVVSTLGSPSTDGYVLASTNAGVLSWIAPGSGGGMTNPMTTTGDLIYSSSGSIPARLAIGAAGTILVGGTTPSWSATPSITSLALSSTSSFALTIQTNLAGAFTSPGSFINIGMVAGNQYNFDIGREESTNNVGNFGFHYAGYGLSTNFIGIGLYGTDNILKVFGDGSAAFSGSLTVGSLNGVVIGTSGALSASVPVTSGYVLSSDTSGNITWVSRLTNPMTTTGDIIYSSSGSIPARLAVGASGTVLIGGATPSWSASPAISGVLSTNGFATSILQVTTTPYTMTSDSPGYVELSGSASVIKLPDMTTVPTGTRYLLANATTSTSIDVQTSAGVHQWYLAHWQSYLFVNMGSYWEGVPHGQWVVTDGKVGCLTNTLTLSGTDSTTMTFPSSSATVAGLGIAQTFSASQAFSAGITGTSIAMSGVITSSGGGIGYATGAGGTVTQGTSRTTGVTLNKLCGTITMFSTTTTAGQTTSFTFTNSNIAATDVVLCSIQTATAGIYFISTSNTTSGSCQISVYTPTAVGSAEAPVINFAVYKGVNA